MWTVIGLIALWVIVNMLQDTKEASMRALAEQRRRDGGSR